MSSRVWGTDTTQWSAACWPWSECVAPPSVELRPGVDASTLVQPWLEEPWNPYRAGEEEKKQKRNRLIELICKVSGQEYNEKKTPKNLKVTVNDIRMLLKKGKQIDVNLNIDME